MNLLGWKVNLFVCLSGICYSKAQNRCPKTSTVKHGKVVFQSRGGITAVFSCDEGYILRGSNVSHCQTDGHWSAPEPLCVTKSENCLPQVVEMIKFTPGKSVVLSCGQNSSFKGKHIEWTSNEKFSINAPDKSGSLIITCSRQGLYVCLSYSLTEVGILRAVNLTSERYNISSLQFKSEECNVTFLDKVSNATFAIGSEINVSCEINQLYEQFSFIWYKDNKPLSVENSLHSLAYVNIKDLKQSDAGNYTCIVRHQENYDCFVAKTVIVNASTDDHICGQLIFNSTHRSKRVIDGRKISPHTAPWMCMLSYDNEPPFCGCSLVSNQWIVTAAHCFKTTKENSSNFMRDVSSKVRVKFGKQLRRKVEMSEAVRGILELIMHPQYRPYHGKQTIANEHDIALGKLNQALTFQANILPICLPPPGFLNSLPEGTLGKVTGWGRVNVRDIIMALTLQEAHLPIVNANSCQASTSYVITDNMLCAGYAESYRPDTCFGDSGGPLVVQEGGIWYLLGIVSWGEGCSSPRKFGVYTKVEKYVNWISSVMTRRPNL